MEPVATTYKPSLWKLSKYVTYFDYFKEYVVCSDFKSLSASLKYMFTHRLPGEGYRTSSKMGTFFIRKQTTDFQFINYAYERKIKEYVLNNIDSFDVFIDAGACIGEYCIWIARLGKKCVAIEPVNFEAIRENVKLNKLEDKIQVFNIGLGNQREKVSFNVPVGLPSSSYLDREATTGTLVDIKLLDDITPEFNFLPNARILMKLDVEGMEPQVIDGAKKFITSRKELKIIYEHFREDNFRNDKALSAIADFSFQDIDPVNRLAIKK